MIFLTMMVMAVATVSARPKMYSERKTQIEYEEAYSKYNNVHEKYEKAEREYLDTYYNCFDAESKYHSYKIAFESDPKNPTVLRKMMAYSDSYKFYKNDLKRKIKALNKAEKNLEKARKDLNKKLEKLGMNKND